ncbi:MULTISPECIES: hypothetical protein [Lacticaseibacillus]|uniref:Uncharacterized protein n=1 Tax=Lacticaseibacillus casei DSM 20011 = JCM 1134 = ATCC 393 TaxID=1423732 RepID=A0AAD1ANK8_LACCA|nr:MULTISPECIES: hypothetical protein [Lacticaseibacillus]MBI6596908.1 hypothetical protein [Lacticaseibacillus casei]MBO1480413.1 hypothetical protein [Lacticaseibacillus casei]MBO2415777.1 hypothetical protein [Lacticaseibacillus casei]MCK2080064.1 hypothetical protein [Lacticaseibacillus casei]MDZ5495989.1 hypothetical protein [Lacticaseibacillus casei]
MKVRLDTRADGFIYAWGTDYTSDNVVDIDESELKKIVVGASKLVDGKIVVDKQRVANLYPADARPTTSPEHQMIAALTLEVAQLKAAKSSD